MDLDGDGHDDMISGSYWPGHVFWFRGLGDGKFAGGTELLNAAGEKLHAGRPWESERKPDMDSLAAAPCAVDFDGDGDFDLLVGNIAGRVMLIRNEGTAKEPSFSAQATAIEAGGKAIDVGGGDAGPTVADWDADGRWDLLVGAGDGSVLFCKNVGDATTPKFAAAQTLIDVPKGQLAHGQEPTRSQMRTKVHVVDYDGDGRVDLLVGDFASVKQPEPVLTDEQRATRERLRKEQSELSRQYSALHEKAEPESPELAALSEKMSAVYEELRPLQGGYDALGWVWLYKRKADSRGN